MLRIIQILISLSLIISITQCELGSSTYNELAGDTLPKTVTYSAHIEPIIDEYCILCHSNKAGVTEEDVSYDNFKEVSGGINGFIETAVDELSMPPGGFPRLTPREMALVEKWQSDGLVK